ncbi:MAG: class I SAM-dependent methyltransferase [Patescibacteria group bacterium]|jgi:ubiquinone/menaquinone biosynthesis C-methylase UbiE
MKKYLRDNQQVYDQLAGEYQERLKKFIVRDLKIASPFINYLKHSFTRARVLDLGPGSGLNSAYFVQAGFKTTAIDISRKMLAIAKKTSPQTKFILADFLQYDFKNLKFEGVFAKAFIHLFPKKDAVLVLEKINRILVPKGVLFVATTFHQKSTQGYFIKKDYNQKLKRFRRQWAKKDLVQTLKNSGFIIKMIKTGYDASLDKKWINILTYKK